MWASVTAMASEDNTAARGPPPAAVAPCGKPAHNSWAEVALSDPPAAKTIVVVDDDLEGRRALQSLLEQAGYQVRGAGESAGVAQVRAEPPDLVLSGVHTAGVEAYAFLKGLRSHVDLARVPVLVLGPERDFAERVRAFREGAVEYVVRPFTPDALLRKIERILDGRARSAAARAAAFEPPPLVQFEELDPEGSEPLALDPPALPLSRGRLPSFELVPEVLRDVLVVDDNVAFRRFLRDLLTGHGFTVHEATDGEQGLQVALEHRPWLILTDVRMPGGDGFEFCRRVRSHSLIRQTPILFLSGWDDYRQRYRGLELGADDFLSKETSVRELLIRIQLLMKRYSDLSRGRQETGISGEVEVFGAPGILQVCHLSRLTGTLEVQRDDHEARVRFRDGEIVGADCHGAVGVEAVFAFLAWETGRFQFLPGHPVEGTPLGAGFSQLLLEGCRRLDESRRTDSQARD
jgi:DNA-binding response OmpR family regulator